MKFYNSEGYNYKFIKLSKKNYMIKESVDLPRINITYLENVNLLTIINLKMKMMKVNIGLIGILYNNHINVSFNFKFKF